MIALVFLRLGFVLLLLLIQSNQCVKTPPKSDSASSSSSDGHQQLEISTRIPYHSPAKFAKGLRKNESFHARLYQAYTDKIGTTNNPYHQAVYDSMAERSFLNSRKSAAKAEKMEKVAKTLKIDGKFSVNDRPRTRLQAKKLQQAASSHLTNGDTVATP